MALDGEILGRLRETCGPGGVLSDPDELLVYESDAYPLVRAVPEAVVFPTSTAMASAVLHTLHEHSIPFAARGAGTSLAGGCLPARSGVCVCTCRMRRILAMDLTCQWARVQAGVVTQHISDAVAGEGYHYAPDPSSQTTCTIGGNVATNAGGPHTLKYGVTANHVLGLTVVLADGEVLELGGEASKAHGYDLKSIFVGSEGTLGLVTEVVVRLTRSPAGRRTVLAVYDRMDDAAQTVSRIIAAGITPAALEMMDQAILNILEDAYAYGFPRDAEAILIIELDGIEAGLDGQMQRTVQICREHGVRVLQSASSESERSLLWKARKTAFGALGRLAPTCITQDGVVPRSRLPHILRFVQDIGRKYGLRLASNFHAGDGNIHPNFLFDGRDPEQIRRVMEASDEILAECVRLGGSVTGEHGIGVEKIQALKLMFSDRDPAAQQRLQAVFDPRRLANPNKVFATEGEPSATRNGERTCHPSAGLFPGWPARSTARS